MNTADIAKMLDGRQYTEEMTPEIEEALNETDIVVVYGFSDDDDGVEFEGAIHDVIDAYEGTIVYLNRQGLIKNKCGNEDCPYHEKEKTGASKIVVQWHDESDAEYRWTFETDIPHERFIIWEDGEKFCRGIVFRLADVDKAPESRYKGF